QHENNAPEELLLLLQDLERVQHKLFVLGSLLACDDKSLLAQLPTLDSTDVEWLESKMDEATAHLPPLRQFILPGGSALSAALHVCRTVVRRGERELAGLVESKEIDPILLVYTNRLSDYFFIMARRANQILGAKDLIWSKDL
ncbi:MAG: cob(I)yrinic acid a,c-diamide adenosyltransferase, partial [Bdellovibrionales bacterium]|nr:cob(I)yrinic acid a,c-diamide adenosyltransferase [Bdellovibrionales bacterium]